MSLPSAPALKNRGECTQRSQCRCREARFGPRYRRQPTQGTEKCHCGHPWWMHDVTDSIIAGRGGFKSSGCGGYYPANQGTNPQLCLCGEPQERHEDRMIHHSESDLADIHSTFAAIARSAPVRAYDNVRSSVDRWNAPPNPPPSMINEANRERMEVAARNRTPNSRSRKQVLQNDSPASSSNHSENYTCAVWPFVLDKAYSYDGHQPPKPIFTVRHFGETVDHLSANNLVFSIKIDKDTSEPWKIIDHHLHEHLTSHGFEVTRRKGDDGNSFHRLSWDILGQSKKRKDHRLILQSGLVSIAEFTLQFLSRQAIDVQLQNNGAKVRCLLIGPTHGNIRGPISNGPRNQVPHACFPWRLLAPFKWLELKTNKDGDECITDECPSGDESPVPRSSTTARRPRSPASPPHRRTVRQRQGNSPSPSASPVPTPRVRPNVRPPPETRCVSPSEHETSGSELEIVDAPNQDRMIVDAIDQDLYAKIESPILENLELDLEELEEDDLKHIQLENVGEWQDRIRDQSGVWYFRLEAPSTTAAADTLITMLKAMASGDAPDCYKPDPPIKLDIESWVALVSPDRPFFIGNGNFSTTGIGDGPANSVFQGALDIRLKLEDRWLPFHGGAYHTLNFCHPPTLEPAESILDLKVDGCLTALVMIQLLLEPYPINPFLVYASFFDGPECLDFLMSSYQEYKPDYLLAMIRDKETRALVAALLSHTPNETFTPTQVIKNPMLYRAVSSGAPVTIFGTTREPQQHTGLVRLLLSELLIGHGRPWEQGQFTAFATGLRLGFCEIEDIVKPKHPDETQNDIYLYAFKLVATLWNHRIESYYDVFNRISFSYVYQPKDEDIAMVYGRLFLLRLYRWIKGKAHPRQLLGNIVSKDKYIKSLKSPLTTRAALFWKAVTDTVVLPANDDRDVKIRLKYMPALLPSQHRRPLYISVCIKQIEVVLDPDVLNMLLEPGSFTGQDDTAFDIWIHTLLVTSENDYNSN